MDYLNFNSPELQEFYSFYDGSRGQFSSEIVVFPRNKLQELQNIFYSKEINEYERYNHHVRAIEQTLRAVSPQEDKSLLESLETKIRGLKQQINALLPRLDELKDNLEKRFKTDQNFRVLLNEWKNAPREVRRIELSPQELAALQRAPSGHYATFQHVNLIEADEQEQASSLRRQGQSAK